jgi:predicted metal-binding membrane protein
VLAEKLVPAGRSLSRAAGLVIVFFGVWVLL